MTNVFPLCLHGQSKGIYNIVAVTFAKTATEKTCKRYNNL